jgi:hypothetical protein
LGTYTTLYCFFYEDYENNRKMFKIYNDYEKSSMDCTLLYQDPSVKVAKGENKLQNYDMGIMTIKKFTQNLMYIIAKP